MRRSIKISVTTVVRAVFWTMAYFVLLSIFASSNEWQNVDYIYTGIFMITLAGAVKVNDYSRRRLFARHKYGLWILSAFCIGVVFAFANDVIFDKLIDFVLPGYYFIAYYSLFDLLKFFGSFLVITTLIGLSMEWFQLQQERATAEFKALANQMNPHFLFNGLTVLYTLSLKNSPETSAAIIKLSDILRYVIYQSSETRVSLASEAQVLRDYIDLQRYRIQPSTTIEYVEQLNGDASIAPLLFLPLLENAFKHGETTISVQLNYEKNLVNFSIVNGKSNIASPAGIGLKNLKERLRLLYPGQHSFAIHETGNEFNVSMQISV